MIGRAASAACPPRLVALPVALCLLLAACGDEAAPEPGQEAEQAVAVQLEDTTSAEPGLRPFLPDEMARSTRAETFPHTAHGQVDCSVCHEVAQGHGSHEGVACGQCHQASAGVTVTALAPAECQSCHHSPDQSRACAACHRDRPTVASVQELRLEVWSAPRARTLTFEHGLHAELDCASCHQALPALVPAESCGSCHANHHVADADCSACHVQPGEEAHDVEVHLTCSGSGCHRAPEVEAFATSRNVCLACHVEQAAHEPGGDCIQCHRVRPESTAWAAWSRP